MIYPLNYYASRNPLNTIIAENMVDLTMFEEEDSSFEYRACFCFSNAYLICQEMIKESPVPLWRFPDYCNIANYDSQDKDFNIIIKAVTLTIVLIWTDHFDEKWKNKNQKILKKMKDYVMDLHVSGETFNLPGGTEFIKPFVPKSVCATVYDILRRGTDIDYVITFDNILYQGTRIVDINNLGSDNYITREEVERMIGEQVKIVSDQLKNKIDVESITDEEVKQMWDDAISKAKEELKGMIPTFDYDEKNETFSITSSEKTLNTADEQVQITKELKPENKQIMEQCEKQEGISVEDFEKLKKDLQYYKSMSETCQDLVKRYEDELGPVEELDDWKEQLSIKERIIFFQALTGCSLKGADKKIPHASQLAKAKLIARFSGNNPSKIRSGINQLYKEIEDVETKKRDSFSQGTIDAAMNVRNYLHLAVEGATIGSKPQRCKIAMQTIDQIYHFDIPRATPPPKDDNFLKEQKPQDE